jgi:glycosyltransferase involved in cell wall biosynthesis
MGGKTVIINATALGARLGGIGMYLFSLIREFAAVKTDMRFVLYLNKTARVHFQDLCFPPGITVRYATRFLSPDYGFAGHLLRLLYSNYLSLRHPSCLCFNGSQLEAMLFRTNQVLMIHDIIPLLMRDGHRKQYFYFKYVLPRVVRSACAVITPSSAVKEQLKELFGVPDSRIHVIYHGAGRAAAGPAGTESREHPPRILFVGRIHPHKNLKGLLAGFRSAQSAVAHQLVIVGVKDRRTHSRASAPDRIVFKGYVSEQEKALLYRTAALLVFPSLHEGFGLPPLEAMMNACPVVASRASCISEICGDAAFYIDPEDAGSIAEGIRRVATDRVLRDALITRGLERARLFSWRTSADKHLTLLHCLLNGCSPGRPEQGLPAGTNEAKKKETGDEHQ